MSINSTTSLNFEYRQKPEPIKPYQPKKPICSGKGLKTVKYPAPQNKEKTAYKVPDALIGAMTLFNSYFDTSGVIKYGIKVIEDIKQEIECKYPPTRDKGPANGTNLDIGEILRRALADFTGEISDGGKDITKDEVYKLYDRFLYGYCA